MEIIYSDQQIEALPCAATIGFFDGVHRGHQHLIRQVRHTAAAQGILAAAVTFDVHPRQVVQAGFLPELLTPLQEKLALLGQLGLDRCMVLHFDRNMAALSARAFMEQVLLRKMNVRHLLVGYDHHFGHDRREGFNHYVGYGRQVGIQVTQGTEAMVAGKCVSSSLIRQYLHQGLVEEAAHGLGRPYSLGGRVVPGQQQGRRMGFPTANISLSEPCQLVPAAGVYEVSVRIDDERQGRPAMMNIGMRPTFHGDHITLEVHIPHFSGNLYGHRLTVDFLRRLREERQFASPEALAQQLQQDLNMISSSKE